MPQLSQLIAAICCFFQKLCRRVEGLFSYAGQVATDRRGSLLPERLHRILFLRENLVMLNFRPEW